MPAPSVPTLCSCCRVQGEGPHHHNLRPGRDCALRQGRGVLLGRLHSYAHRPRAVQSVLWRQHLRPAHGCVRFAGSLAQGVEALQHALQLESKNDSAQLQMRKLPALHTWATNLLSVICTSHRPACRHEGVCALPRWHLPHQERGHPARQRPVHQVHRQHIPLSQQHQVRRGGGRLRALDDMFPGIAY